MNFAKGIFCIILSATLLYLCNGRSLVPPPGSQGQKGVVATTTTHRSVNLTCECGETTEPICANNGVTYTNRCKFECAKHKDDRLRIIKEGNCGKYFAKTQFWSFG